jgi:hypothetical protein
MPKAEEPKPLTADGTTSVTISYWLTVHQGRRPQLRARYLIECNHCGLSWDYEPPPSYDADYYLPLSQLQCPDGCEGGEDDG